MSSINFGALDPLAPYKGAAATNALLKSFAHVRAGHALAGGDVGGATDELNRAGDLEGARQVEDQHWSQQENVRKLDATKQKESSEFAADASAALYKHYVEHKGDPDGGVGAVMAGFDQIAPIIAQRGATPEQVAVLRQKLAEDPGRFLTMMHDEAMSHLKNFSLPKGAVLTDPEGNTLADNIQPEIKTVRGGDGSTSVIQVDPESSPGEPGGEAPVGPSGASSEVAPTEALDGPTMYEAFTSPHEGGLNPSDLNGSPTNMGFNQAANPDIDVKTLTPETAAKRFNDKYYVPSGAPKMPPALAAIHSDTYFMNPSMAGKFLKESGGDPNKYMDLREAWQGRLAAHGDAAKYGKAWSRRNSDLRAFSAQLGGGTDPVEVSNPHIRELYRTPGKPEVKWTTTRAGKGDPKYPEGTVYATNSGTGDTKILINPTTKAAGGGTNKPANLSQSEQKDLSAIRKQNDELKNVSSWVDTFVALNKKNKTGGQFALPGMVQVLSATNSDYATMSSITSRLTPAMRNGLPGAASDKDVAMFADATVNIKKPYEANLNNAKATKAAAARIGDHLAFLEAYALEHHTINGAAEIWGEYADSHPMFAGIDKNGGLILNKTTPWRQVIKLGGEASPAPVKGRTRTYDPATGAFN